MMTSQPKEEKLLGFSWNVPNILTITRMVLVPVFLVVFLLHPNDQTWRLWATAIFVVAILTDSADGYIARKYDMVTNFGKIWDSIADKSLTGGAFIVLSVVGELPWWMTIIILLREWGITALRFAILQYGVMAANRGGKLKTLVQSFALIAFLAWLPELGFWFEVVKWALMWIAFLLTVVTGVDYLYEAYKLRKASLAAGGRSHSVMDAGSRWRTNRSRQHNRPTMNPQAEDRSLVAAEAIRLLEQAKLTIATCESITGGGIGASFTAVPGSSAVFRGGLITYATDLKVSLAGVDERLVRESGVINERTAKQMALGAALSCRADIGLSATGVAGPDWQDDERPGMVWLGLALPVGWDDRIRARRLQLDGDRAQIRAQTIKAALAWLCECLGEPVHRWRE